MTTLPEHVRQAFHVETGDALALGQAWDYGWQVRNTVVMPVVQSDNASLSAKLRDHIKPDHVRLARPVRATDGRYVVSGWRASTFEAGTPQAGRVDEIVLAGLRLADALAGEKIPPFVQSPITGAWSDKHIFVVADRAAWADDPAAVLALGMDGAEVATPAVEQALKLAARILPLVPPIDAPDQLGHADMLATTLFAGSSDPVVTDIVAVAHPHGYTAAQAIVDGLLADAVDPGIIGRFASIEHLMALLLRALLYRIFVHALHPEANSQLDDRFDQVADWIIRG